MNDTLAAAEGGVVLEKVVTGMDRTELLLPMVDKYQWKLQPYNAIAGELALISISPFRSDPPKLVAYPYGTVAAVADDEIIVGVYMYQRCAWLGIKATGKARASMARPLSLPGSKFTTGPLECTSLGLTETTIDSWSTACWVDNSLHLISDDGKYERFKLRENAMVRVGQLSELSPPAAVCQGQRHLWLLSETKTGSISATEIGWNADDKLIRTDRDLGEISMDQAALRVLAAEREGK